MKTIIYLIRHSEPFKIHKGPTNTNESIFTENQKSPLSIAGEKKAEKWANNIEFNNLDIVYSSNYVRAMSTAKYFAHRNNLKVNIDERFNERIHGVDSWEDLPFNFEKYQFKDENYKVGYGESRKEVQVRMHEAITDILKEYKGKKIAIISHATAIAFLLKKFSNVQYNRNYTFKENKYFDGKWNYLETFKLEFDEKNELITLTHIT